MKKLDVKCNVPLTSVSMLSLLLQIAGTCFYPPVNSVEVSWKDQIVVVSILGVNKSQDLTCLPWSDMATSGDHEPFSCHVGWYGPFIYHYGLMWPEQHLDGVVSFHVHLISLGLLDASYMLRSTIFLSIILEDVPASIVFLIAGANLCGAPILHWHRSHHNYGN